MKNQLIKFFNIKHACQFDKSEIILDGYKDSLYKAYQEVGLVPVCWNEMKDWKPKCLICGKEFSIA